MSPLFHLSHLGEQQKWIVENAQICCVQRQPGKLKNLLDFNAVIKFTNSQLQGKTREDIQSYMDNLSTKYAHIKKAIDRQDIVTRLFLHIILCVNGFDYHFDRLRAAAKKLPSIPVISLPLINIIEPPIPLKSLPVMPMVIAPSPLPKNSELPKGGFINGGNTCFIAAALHCLNTMAPILPKNLDQDVKKKENESEAMFIERKRVIENLLTLLAASNQNKLVSAEEMNHFRQVWCAYDSSIPPLQKPGDAGIIYNNLLTLLSAPSLELNYIKNGQRQSYDRNLIDFSIPNEKANNHLPGCSIKDNVCVLDNYELREALTGKVPLFVPIRLHKEMVGKNNCTIPLVLKFANSDTTYELVSCGIGGKGHAYCYIQNQDQIWIKYDDHRSSSCKIEEIEGDIQDYGTLLVYRQKE